MRQRARLLSIAIRVGAARAARGFDRSIERVIQSLVKYSFAVKVKLKMILARSSIHGISH
jgi:hypothetical protein